MCNEETLSVPLGYRERRSCKEDKTMRTGLIADIHGNLVALDAVHTLLCFHGSPRFFHDIIRSTTAEDDLAGMLAGFSATVMAGGHTHGQMLRRYRETIIVNPGSVGLPVERGPGADHARNPPWAEYALVSQENGVLRIELRRVPVDL